MGIGREVRKELRLTEQESTPPKRTARYTQEEIDLMTPYQREEAQIQILREYLERNKRE